uniref:Uncharacterized protein n=1 Tax=Panagrolaimus sp. PS1159 TaxID=55785 RepID=A0AC35GJT3_9BILA
MDQTEAPIASKSEMELVKKLEIEHPARTSPGPAATEDNDDETSGDDDEEDDDEEEETPVIDKNHPSLIHSSSRKNSEKSHAPPKSAALLASGDVYEFQSSPEDDEGKPVKKFGRVGPPATKKLKESSPIEEEESRLQIDDEEDETSEAVLHESPKRKVPPLKIVLPLKAASDEDNTRDVEEKIVEFEPIVKKSARGRKPAAGTQARLTRSRIKAAAEEVSPGRRNKPTRRTATSSSLIGNVLGEEYDDYGLSPGLGVDEDSQEAETRPESPPIPPPVRAWEMIQENTFKGSQGLSGLIIDKWKESIKTSLEQVFEEPEILNYDLYKINTKDYFTKESKYHPEMPKLPPNMDPRVKELFLKQLRQRRLRQTEHEKERNRLQMFAEREYLRVIRNSIIRERTKVSVLRMMRDSDACNPIVYDSFRPRMETPSMKPETKEQVLEKIGYLAKSLNNKHRMESDNLQMLQKDELEKALQNWDLIPPTKKIENKAVPKVKVIKMDFKYLTEEIKDADEKVIEAAKGKDEAKDVKSNEEAMDVN